MSLSLLASVKDGPRSLPLDFGPIRVSVGVGVVGVGNLLIIRLLSPAELGLG